MTFILSIPWAIFYAMPYFINKMICDQQAEKANMTDLNCTTDKMSNYRIFKYLCYVCALTYCIGWGTQSAYAKSEIDDVELRPEVLGEEDEEESDDSDYDDDLNHNLDSE